MDDDKQTNKNMRERENFLHHHPSKKRFQRVSPCEKKTSVFLSLSLCVISHFV